MPGLAIPTTLSVDTLDSTLGRDPYPGLENSATFQVGCNRHLSRILFDWLLSRRDFQDVVAQNTYDYDV